MMLTICPMVLMTAQSVAGSLEAAMAVPADVNGVSLNTVFASPISNLDCWVLHCPEILIRDNLRSTLLKTHRRNTLASQS